MLKVDACDGFVASQPIQSGRRIVKDEASNIKKKLPIFWQNSRLRISVFFLFLMFSGCGGVTLVDRSYAEEHTEEQKQTEAIDKAYRKIIGIDEQLAREVLDWLHPDRLNAELQKKFDALNEATRNIIGGIDEELASEISYEFEHFVDQSEYYTSPVHFENKMPSTAINHLGWSAGDVEPEGERMKNFIENELINFGLQQKHSECFRGLTEEQVSRWKQYFSLGFNTVLITG